MLCFLAVAEAGSLTAAAERLGCSKAHVSAELAALERALGAQLLLRTTRRQSLTESGRIYLDYARNLRDTLGEADGAVSALRSEVSGKLRITAPTSFGDSFLAPLVLSFQRRHVGIEVDLDLSVIRRDLVADGYDLAFRSSRTVDEHLVARPLGVIREVLVAAPEVLVAHSSPRTPDDLTALPCVINSHFRDDHLWTLERGGMTHTVAVGGRISINHFGGLRRAALYGAGVVRLPLYLLAEDIAAGRLVRVLPDWEPVPTPLYLVHPARRHQPLRTRVFIDFVLGWFQQEGQRPWFR